jgi:hypothetical protein
MASRGFDSEARNDKSYPAIQNLDAERPISGIAAENHPRQNRNGPGERSRGRHDANSLSKSIPSIPGSPL